MGGESYKIWGSALVALTVAFGIGVAINQVTHTDHLDIKAYVVDVPDGGAETAAVVEEKVLEPITPLLASADIAAGEKAFKRCGTCHTRSTRAAPTRLAPISIMLLVRPRAMSRASLIRMH